MENSYHNDPLPGLDDDGVVSFPDDEGLPGDLPARPVTASDPGGAPARTDPELDAVYEYFLRRASAFGPSIRQALDEVIAPGRTRRWNLDQCNNQEKAYVGVNIENILRLIFDLPEGPHG